MRIKWLYKNYNAMMHVTWQFTVAATLSVLQSLAHCQTVDLDNYQSLTSDIRSYRVGEPIVVLIIESMTAESAARTDSNRNTSIAASAGDSTNNVSVGLGVDADSNGSGRTARSGKVRAQMSAVISEVLPNQLYRIEGIQNLTINEEVQTIRLNGVIRAADLHRGNTIYSYEIAGASIELVGSGDISLSQRRNLVHKIFNWLGLL